MKNIMFSLFCLSALALIAGNCKSKQYAADKLPEKQIRFGKGGGFFGREVRYTLLENGQLFQDGLGITNGLKEIADGKSAKALFKAAKSAGLERLQFQHPGNVYSFIEFPSGDGQFNRVVWGDSNHAIGAEIVVLFEKLMALVPEKDKIRKE